MEGSTEAPATDSSARTFSQVVFIDIPYSYPPSTPVTCCYTLTAAFQPNPRDWVGIFKVGWSTTKDYHTFVWVEPCLDVVGQQSVTREAVFKDYYLPKDEIEFYQFCYVDSTGQVRGASTPFCFRNPVEQSMESSPDDDLLVITTQEQVEQSVRERTELQKELDQIREEKENLKRALQMEQQEAASLKGQNEQKEKEMSQLVKELDQIKEQNENLKSNLQQQLKETDQLKTRAQEKYDQAVMKINQLKDEREELRGRVDAQSVEIATLNSKLREEERELFKMKDSIQLLQIDLQSSEKEKERLCVELQRSQSLAQNMDNVKRENQELHRRLSQQETVQNCPEEDLRVQHQTLASQLQDAQAKLAAEKDESKNTRTRAEYLERELLQVREQLENVILSCDQAQRKSSKQELQLREAHEMIADKDGIIDDKEHMIKLVNQEKEELARENQNLISDIEGLRRALAGFHAASPADSPHTQPGTTSPAGTTSTTFEWQPQDTAEEVQNLYETIGSVGDPEEELSLVCRHCQERFPLITRHELEQHEQCHRVCPFCTMICDNMEQSVFEDHVYSHEL
ncbi:calcium-binding and coiled-coil domain-containing protein 2 isoform X2 [Siniperca chuatsi]|uniref:calcium-binding and coiled-coil domain-containing protein 2 isoform X2 n=1 Tax=Siniperca chuatsi TaxID=119488 RepID=UPI001CE21E0F|nr:calcium-binding and coiled-coil domain-containing protein 2 isoform X2 [Siniperca chuatsi]